MNRMSFKDRAALASGSATLALMPAAAWGALVTVDSSPITISFADPDGTVVTWNVDGAGQAEFQLELDRDVSTTAGLTTFRSTQVLLNSRTDSGIQLAGRGLVGPSSTGRKFQNLGSGFAVGPTVAPYTWGASNERGRDVFYTYVSSVFAGNGFDDFIGGMEGANFFGFRFDVGGDLFYGWAQLDIDLTMGMETFTISQWTYNDAANMGVVVGTPASPPPPPPLPPSPPPPPGVVSEPATALPALALLAMGAAGVRRWRQTRQG